MSVHVRLIPTLTLKDGRIIKTIEFDRYHDIGDPVSTGKVFESQDVDELVFLDITATQEGREPDFRTIEAFAEETTMPLTVGGGVQSIEHMDQLLRIGADKVSINSSAVRNPELVTNGARTFGTQCIVISIDVKKAPSGYEVYVSGGGEATGLDANEWAKKVEQLGAGEILLTSIDRDGTMGGYDLDLIRQIAESVRIPVIASGGCGTLSDLTDGVSIGRASAVAAASLFAFTDNKPMKAKSYMQVQGINVRPI